MSGWSIADSGDPGSFELLEARLKAILPAEYQDSEDVQPLPMGSAALKHGADGKVAWNEMWATFCDLAMAGGPPHKGRLLEPGSGAEIAARPDRYREVVEEICRGIGLVTGFAAEPSRMPGWVRVDCVNYGTAEWLARAIAMENVSVRCEGRMLDLPAGPGYRIEKEIKNVVTVIAKTCHYWVGHMDLVQRQLIARLFTKMDLESPLLQPAFPSYDSETGRREMLRAKVADNILQITGLPSSGHQYDGWLGLVCPDVRAAIWIMRALVASNILSRREETVFFVPINPASDPHGEVATKSVARVHGFALARGILHAG